MATSPAAVVLLVRHGQTALNAEGKLRGRADPDLDDVGVAQVRAAAAALRRFRIGRVVTSPLRRAVATASAIASASPGASAATLMTDAAFIDRDYGPWTAHVKAEVVGQWGSLDAAPGVEPAADLLARARGGLNRHAASGATVAIVTHDAVIRSILADLRPGIDPTVDTASWAVLRRDEAGWNVESFDNIAGTTPP